MHSTTDTCLFKRSKEEDTIHYCLFGQLIKCGKRKRIKETIKILRRESEQKDLRNVNYYLGINIKKQIKETTP